MRYACRLFYVLVLLFAAAGAAAQNSARFSDIKPGMTDEMICEKAIRVANERAENLRCPERYYKAVIISYNWRLELDRSGFVTGRSIHLQLLCVRAGGECGMTSFTFRQKRKADDEFSDRLQYVSCGDMYTVDCED